MTLSIIIVSWNTRELLDKCLASIFANPPAGEFEVLVVDNHSSDGSLLLVKTHYPQVRLIENRENLGFARGNNQAIQQSKGDYVLLLNPDTEIKSGALQELVVYLDANPTVGAAGARMLNPDGSLQPSCSPTPTLARELLRMFHLPGMRSDGYYAMEHWDKNLPRDVDVLLGACLILRREVLDQIGLLDEAYFVYSEEVDLCLQVQRAGWRLAWVPQAEVVHYGGQSTQQIAEAMFLSLYQGKILFFRKHYGWAAVQVYKMILFLAALGRLLITPIALLSTPSRRRQRLALSSHYRRLLSALPEM